MTPEQAKAWLPLIQAVADGKTLQYKSMIQSTLEPVWCDIKRDDLLALWSHDCLKVRIKPEVKKGWYRVVLFKDGIAYLAKSSDLYDTETNWEKDNLFVRWLTDKTEYEWSEDET